MTRNGLKLFALFSKAELRTVKKSSVSILKKSKSSWQFSRMEIMPGKHSVSFLVKQVINTGMAGKRVGYRESIKSIALWTGMLVVPVRHLTVAIS